MDVKTRIDDLAVFGGRPAFQETLHVGRPNVGDRNRLFERITDILDRKWLTNNGVHVQELERRIADLAGVRHCIVTCNATVALEIAARALDLSGEVILPSMTFVATAHALQWQGIAPVFGDIRPDTLTLDPGRVEELITPRTTAILGVHLWGRPCDVEGLSAVARRHGLRLLFDAAHAFGCSSGGRMVGGFGDLEVFSFHSTKFINTFEGGAVVTDDDGLAARIRLMKNFGFAGHDQVVCLGTNGKMSEVSAAMGLTSLESLPDFVETNRRNYHEYRRQLQGVTGFRLFPYDEREKCNYQYVAAEVDETAAGIGRDQVQQVLWAENVLARRYFYPGCHRMEPYRTLYPDAGRRLPETERVLERVLTLPTGTAIHLEDVRRICQILGLIVRHSGEVRGRLEAGEAVTSQPREKSHRS